MECRASVSTSWNQTIIRLFELKRFLCFDVCFLAGQMGARDQVKPQE